MKIIDTVVQGFKQVFSGKDILKKHLFLFIIAGIITIPATYLQLLSDTLKETKDITIINIPLFIIALLVMIGFGIYMGGYNLIFCHNAFKKDEKNTLPEFTFKEPFKIFLNALPLMIAWFIYVLIAFALMIAFFIGFSAYAIIRVINLIAIAYFSSFIQFVLIAYTKYYNKAGLFDITILSKFIKHSIKEFTLTALLFIPILWIAAASFGGFITTIAAIIGIIASSSKDVNIAIYITGVFYGYAQVVIQLVWYYCLVRIYDETISPAASI